MIGLSRLVDGPGPGVWDALRGDPSCHLAGRTLDLLETDQARISHRYLRPVARLVSRLLVAGIVFVKRIVPMQWSNHDLLDRLGVWFMSRFVSPEGGELLLRHFVLETNILSFIVRNSAIPNLVDPTLRPLELTGLGGNAVIVHDLNVYETLAGLCGQRLPGPTERPLDFAMLHVPPIATTEERRWVQLDLETGLCFMNVAFALLTTSDEYRRAVHSLQLDESLLGCLSDLTGDEVFRSWRPAGYAPIVHTNRDVPRELFAHAVIHEYAHGRLLAAAPS